MAVHLDTTLSSIVACYLKKHGLLKTLSIFLLETKSECPMEVDVISLETLYDIYLLTQTSGNRKNRTKKENNILELCEMEVDTKKLQKEKLQTEETVPQEQRSKKKETKKSKKFSEHEDLEEIAGEKLSDELRKGQEVQGRPDLGETQDVGGKKTKREKKGLIHLQEQLKKEKELSGSELSHKILGTEPYQVAELKSKKVVESPHQVSSSTEENKEGMKACSVREEKFNLEDTLEKREKRRKKRKTSEVQESIGQCDKVRHEGEFKGVKGVLITREMQITSVEGQHDPTIDRNGNLEKKKKSGSDSMSEQGEKTWDDKFQVATSTHKNAFDNGKISHWMHGESLKREALPNKKEKKSKKKENHVVELMPHYVSNVKEDMLLEDWSLDQKAVPMKDGNQCLTGIVQHEDWKGNEEPVNQPTSEKSQVISKKKKKREVTEEPHAKDRSFEMKAGSIENFVCKDNGMKENESPLKGIDKERLELAKTFQNGSNTQEKKTKDDVTDKKTPTGLLAFKRVDPDKVEFADPRLQDNSYWAKKRAEEGYGAKAQEVLGQVRGKDFRHEKTKKKRGSYKGGAIDFHSNSIKFNYSDEDE